MKVVEIGMVDIYRDGGSYGMVFEANDGQVYELFLETLAFEPGSLESHRAPVLYLGGCNSGNIVVRMSWEEAEAFVAPLRFDDERFQELIAIVMRHGRRAD